jgi:hypothetical protein
MFLLYHSEGCNICGGLFRKCYINDLHTTTCSGTLGHHKRVFWHWPKLDWRYYGIVHIGCTSQWGVSEVFFSKGDFDKVIDPLSPLPFVVGVDLLQDMIINLSARQDGCFSSFLVTRLSYRSIHRQHTFVYGSQFWISDPQIDYVLFPTSNIRSHAFSPLTLTLFMPLLWLSSLGLLLGTTRPTFINLAPLADNVEGCLNGCSRFLNFGGKLTFVNSVLSSLPTFYMCMPKLNKIMVNVTSRKPA